jgi:hypothetical protein
MRSDIHYKLSELLTLIREVYAVEVGGWLPTLRENITSVLKGKVVQLPDFANNRSPSTRSPIY